MSSPDGHDPKDVSDSRPHAVGCMDPESAFLYLSGELDTAVSDATAAHLAACEPCRGLVEDVSGLIGSSRELLQLAVVHEDEPEPPPADVVMARGAVRAKARMERRTRRADSSAIRVLSFPQVHSRLPLRAAAGLLLCAGLAGVLWWTDSDLSAAELLREAKTVQAAVRTPPDTATRRVLQLEERQFPGGALLSQKRVEIWESAAEGKKARRLYDAGNALLAGEWTDRTAPPVLAVQGQGAPVNVKPPASHASEVWRWDPSVTDFEFLARGLPTLEAEGTASEYVITARGESTAGPALVRLVLSRPGLRPIEQRIVFTRHGTGEQVEYRLIESELRTMPLASVASAIFRPDPELLPRVAARPAAPASPAPVRPRPAPALSNAEADGLELDVTYRLHRLEGCIAGEPTISRGTTGIRVRAAVETEACLVEAQRVFGSLQDDRRVQLGLVQQSARAPAGTADLSPDVTGSAVHAELLSQVRVAAATDAQARQVAAELARWVARRSREASAEARAIESLMTTWSVQRLQTLDVDARAKWQGILRDHARSLARDAEALRIQIERTAVQQPAEPPATASIADVTDVPGVVALLARLAEQQRRIVAQLLAPAERVANRTELLEELVTTLEGLSRAAAQLLEPWSLTAG